MVTADFESVPLKPSDVSYTLGLLRPHQYRDSDQQL
jgi:hypothetical protein